MISAQRVVVSLLGVALTSVVVTALTSAGVTQLKNDNGHFHQGSFAGRIIGDVDGAVLMPAAELFPITLQSVEFAFHRPRGADHIADSAQVRVRIYAMQDGVPGDILAESEPRVLAGFDVWHSVPLDPPLVVDEAMSFMAAVKWESGSDDEPAPSIATDSNMAAPQETKDQLNLFHDANIVLRPSACQTEFCTHSQFWGDPTEVGFNMIRVTIDSPAVPTATPTREVPTVTPVKPTPAATATVTPLPQPDPPVVYLPTLLRDYSAFLNALRVGTVPGEAVSYALTSGDGLADLCWPGKDNNLWVGSEPAHARGIMRSVLWFDLSNVPAGAVLLGADLRLVAVEAPADTTPITVSVHDITAAWTDCPTWNSLAHAVGTSWGSLAVGSTVESYSFDVTALVAAWLGGDLPNHGLMLLGDETGAGRYRGFVPTASTQEDLRPTLTIRYRAP